MFESWQIPILVEAVNFLFDIGRFVLDEIKTHREQRKVGDSSPGSAKVSQTPTDVLSLHTPAILSKEEALKVQVEEARAKQKEAEIQHLLRLAKIYNTSYHLAKEKYALWGRTLVPAVIVHELEDAEKHLLETVEKLKATTEGVLGKKLTLQ